MIYYSCFSFYFSLITKFIDIKKTLIFRLNFTIANNLNNYNFSDPLDVFDKLYSIVFRNFRYFKTVKIG